MKIDKKSGESSEVEWIAMIGAVASTLVIFILIMVIFVPIFEKGRFVLNEDFLSLFLEEKAKDYFIIRNIEALDNEKEVQKKLINYIDENSPKNKKYTLTIKFGKQNDLSTGANYINAYISNKLILNLLLKANMSMNNISVKIEEDNKLAPGKSIAIVKGI